MSPLADLLTDAARALRFYSRLPVPALPWEEDPHALPDFARMPRALPLAGAVIGAIGAAVLLAASWLGLGATVAAALAVAALTLVTGAFHEDGLADLADSFGGATRERRLEIMRDSRLGSFGVAALVLAFALRIAALAALCTRLGPGAAAAALVAVAAMSRVAGLVVLRAPPARGEGAAHAVGRPSPATLATAAALCGLLALLAGAATTPRLVADLAIAFAALMGSALLVRRLALRHLGGQTGDVAGAAQQVAEIVALLALLIRAPA